MTAKQNLGKPQERFAFYMDILGHDILNNNQAVLGYLELILAEPANDRKVRKYAEKAVPHIRTSTLLIENVKKVLQARSMEPAEQGPVELVGPLQNMQKELERFFPDRRVRLAISDGPGETWVAGGKVVEDLIYNVLVDLVKLDGGKNVNITAKFSERQFGGHACWSLRLENPNAELPPIMKGKDIESVYLQDSSTAVRMAGVLFAKMVTSALGGDFTAEELFGKGERKGAAFTMTLRKAVGK